MFKSLEYVGFESRPDLRAKAEAVTPVLAGVAGVRRTVVDVRWAPAADPGGVLDLTLRRALPNGVEGEFTGTFGPDDFATPRWLRLRCLEVWDELLGVLLDKQHARVMEALHDPVEA